MKHAKYSRIFTDFFPKHFFSHFKKNLQVIVAWINASEKHLAFFMMIYLFTIGMIFFYLSSIVLGQYKKIKEEKRYVQSKFEYWQGVVRKHPDYPDAFYEVSLYSLKLGDKETAKLYLERALTLDPHFKIAKDLLRTL